jgi:hypothetical protein
MNQWISSCYENFESFHDNISQTFIMLLFSRDHVTLTVTCTATVMLVGGARTYAYLCMHCTIFWYFSKMSSSWLVIALALCVASLAEGKSANLVLLTDAPGQSVRHLYFLAKFMVMMMNLLPIPGCYVSGWLPSRLLF